MAGITRHAGRTVQTGPSASARASQVVASAVDQFVAGGVVTAEAAESLRSGTAFAALLLEHGVRFWDAPRPAPHSPSRGRGVVPLPKLPPITHDTAAEALRLLRDAQVAFDEATKGADQVDADAVFDLAQAAEDAANLLTGGEMAPGASTPAVSS